MRVSVKNTLLTSLKAGKIPGIDIPFVIGMAVPVPSVQSQVTVKDILNIGIVMNGATPEVYDQLDLTGTELKILRYIFKNLVRVYSSVQVYPRDHKGTPRFWRGKERMAEDCKVSPTAFRMSVRHLAEMGLVTSMEPDDEYEYATSSITLDVKFIGFDLDNLSSEPKQKYYQLTRYLYGDDNLALLRLNHPNTDPFQRFITQEEQTLRQMREDIKQWIIRRKPIHGVRRSVIRQAIHGVRKAIVQEKTMVEVAQEERKKLEWVMSPQERKVAEVKKYYEYKCRNALNTTGFCILSTKREEWREDKKWKWLTRIYQQCKDNGWDYKVFIDAQFDRLQWFKTPQKYVYLNQFFSTGAIKYYHKYVKNYKECNSVDGKIRVKTSKVKTFIQEVAEAVVMDCERISYFLKSAFKRPAYKDLTREELKIVYISNHWTSLSKYYLADLPWFLPWLRKLPSDSPFQELGDSIAELQKSKAAMRKIHLLIAEAERQMDIPKTMELQAA